MKMIRAAIVVVVVIGVAAVHVYCETAEKHADLILKTHNDLRRKQQSSNINELVWSDTLAKEADQWLSNCKFEHEQKGRGENLAFSTAADDVENMEQAMQSWYDEINDYNYAGKACGASCHYTQMIWYKTKEIGCAMRRCPTLGGTTARNAWFFGCWYDPLGNWANEYPYNRGKACADCWKGQSCDKGLCSGKGTPPCVNKHTECANYKGFGACKKQKDFMKEYCQKDCGFCKD